MVHGVAVAAEGRVPGCVTVPRCCGVAAAREQNLLLLLLPLLLLLLPLLLLLHGHGNQTRSHGNMAVNKGVVVAGVGLQWILSE